jgi:hypothetical protein
VKTARNGVMATDQRCHTIQTFVDIVISNLASQLQLAWLSDCAAPEAPLVELIIPLTLNPLAAITTSIRP